MKEEIKPYAVLNETGAITAMLQTNDKGYKKSIENSRIWAVNPETGRLLPVDDYGRPSSFRDCGDWYEASLGAGASGSTAPAAAGSSREKVAAGATPQQGTGSGIIERLYSVIEQRKREMPEGSYTTHLFNSGMPKIKKKTGEEAVELLLAESRSEMIYEAADLVYHMLVMLAAAEISPGEIFSELESRE